MDLTGATFSKDGITATIKTFSSYFTKLDLTGSLQKLSEFLEKPLKHENLFKLTDHLCFNNFKNNSAVNALEKSRLIRKGEIGGNPEMTETVSRKFDEMEKLMFKDSGIVFPTK